MEALDVRAALDPLARQVARTWLEDRWGERSALGGEEINRLLPDEQVGYLLLKRLYLDWRRETTRLRSPYFDFEHPDVKAALGELMETLSFHISLSRETTEDLATAAISETAHLLADPFEYLELELAAQETWTLDELKTLRRFVRRNRVVLDRLMEGLEERTDLATLIHRLHALSEDFSDPLDELEGFAAAVQSQTQVDLRTAFDEPEEAEEPAPVIAETEEEAEPEKEAPEAESAETQDEPEATEEGEEEEDAPEARPEIREIIAEPWDLSEPPADMVDEADSEDTPDEDESAPTPDTWAQRPEPQKPVGSTLDLFTLNDQFAEKEKARSLNEEHHREEAEKETVAHAAATKKVVDLRSAIGINQRYQFISTLFGGDNQAYDEALTKIEGCESFEDASSLIVDNYVAQYTWDLDRREVQEFFDLIARRF